MHALREADRGGAHLDPSQHGNPSRPRRPAGIGPGTEGGQVTHYPKRSQAQVDADRKRKEAAKKTKKRRRENSWTEYQRIGRILAEVGSDSREEWLKTERPRGGSNFKPGEGPKDPRDMTPDERKDRDEKTAKLIVRRDAQRAESTRRSGTPEPRGGHRRRS